MYRVYMHIYFEDFILIEFLSLKAAKWNPAREWATESDFLFHSSLFFFIFLSLYSLWLAVAMAFLHQHIDKDPFSHNNFHAVK